MLIMQTDWRATVTLLNQGPMIIGQGMIKKFWRLPIAQVAMAGGRYIFCYTVIN